MAIKTDMVSLRIEPQLRKELKSLCKSHNCTMSDVMRDGIVHKTGGAIKLFESPDPDDDVAKLLTTIAGGSTVGILSYKAIYEALKNKFADMEEGELQTYAILSGVVTAILTGIGLNKLLKLAQ